MKQLKLLILMGLIIFCSPAWSVAAPVHSFDCKNCHLSNKTIDELGGDNVCLSCHDSTPPAGTSGFVTGDASASFGNNPAPNYETSHNWAAISDNPAAGAAEPVREDYPGFFSNYGTSGSRVTCSRCHQPHADSGTNPKLLTTTASGYAAFSAAPLTPNDMCLACHAPWNMADNNGWLTHPIVDNYNAAVIAEPDKYKSPLDNTYNAAIQLVNGGVSCTSCHGVHFVDSDSTTADGPTESLSKSDGKLLRGDGPLRTDKSSLCLTCHLYQQHGNVATETVGCLICHSGHSYDTSAPNYFILRKTATTATYNTVTGLDYSSPDVLVDGLKYTFWNDQVDGTNNGYCERCHGDANDISTAEYHVTSAICTDCHKHDNSLSGFGANCGACHGNGNTQTSWPDGIANNVITTYSWADDPGSHEVHVAAIGTGNLSCTSCHPGNPPTGHYLDDTTGVQQAEVTRMDTNGDGNVNYWLFAEGPTAGSGTPVYFKTASGTDDTDAYFRKTDNTCYNIDCHGGLEFEWGTAGDCLVCHSTQLGSRAAIVGQFSSNSHHVQGTSLTAGHCYQCHWEANSDGTINAAYHGGVFDSGAGVDLVIYGAGSRPASYIEGTTAVHYVANGSRAEVERLNHHCLGCHSNQNSITEPFGDGKTPQEYAWDNTSVASRYSQSGTTSFGKYTSITYAAQKIQTKAFSAHGNATANEGGWSATTGVDSTLPNTRDGSANVACYDCHNSHGSNVAGKATSYNSATVTGGLLKDTESGIGGYSATYTPVSGGTADDKNERNPGASLCMDCHLTADGGTSYPWGYSTSFGASEKIIGYYDSPYFTPGGSGAQVRYPYKAEAGYKGGHFGASSPLNSAVMGSIDGLCTPCHDPHGVSTTLGSDQQYGVPLLKGTWLTSLYKEDVAPSTNYLGYTFNFYGNYHIDQNTFGNYRYGIINGPGTSISQTPDQFAGLCLTCHPQDSLTVDAVAAGTPNPWKSKDRVHESVKGWKTSNGIVKHKYPCSKCHTPHMGSGLPRLMVTNCLDYNHRGRVAWQENPRISNQDPYSGIGGRIPGSHWECDPNGCYDFTVTCHDSPNANNGANDGKDQSWNLATPWSPPLVISNLNISTSYFESQAMATVTWTTNLQSDTFVEFWWDPGDVRTQQDATLVTSHTSNLLALENHKTYYIQARSVRTIGASLKQDSVNDSFYISLPPTIPSLIAEPDDDTCSGTCSVTLDWSASSDTVDNGPIEYYVELSTTADFASPIANSGWISATSWTPGALTTNTGYSWRARSRDANHTTANDPPSGWSATDYFVLTDGTPPSVTLIYPTNNAYIWSVGADLGRDIAFQWSSAPPASAYRVLVSTDPGFSTILHNSGWITSTSWTRNINPGYNTSDVYYWKVQAETPVTGTIVESVAWSFTLADTGSCPFLFTWDGSSYVFEADLYGAGKLALKTSYGYLKPQPNDYYILKNEPAQLGGLYDLRLVEERVEIDYLDEFKLYALDAPDNRKVYAEKPQGGTSYFAGLGNVLHTVSVDATAPVSVTHVNTGQDVRNLVVSADANMLELSPDRNNFTYQTLELDLGDIQLAPQVKIAMDAMSMFPNSEEGVALSRTFGPRTKLEVQDADGNWVSVPKAVGSLPKPPEFSRPFIFDISNIWISDSRKVRFTFLFKTYIDWIHVDTTLDEPVTITEVPMVDANLHVHGFDPKSSTNERYVYVYSPPTGQYAYLPGSYTRYGDVVPLLSATDDKFVIYGGGDEIALTFNPISNPPSGQARSYLVYTNGYYKDLKVDVPHTVEPLPFAGMSNFPYDEAVENYPDDADHNAYRAEYNTRIVSP